ncbi:MAG: sulfotransferase family protein [Candidatus Competibacteraceae bacterium]|nr:sulfotransferase family protein [Candidatus Competibacteraceae bacterium]
MDNSQSFAVLILGMHRSGTSCLAGSLQEAGLYLGEVNTAAPHNAKGNRESRAIMELQDDLLRANGGDWDAPPEQVVWSPEHRARRDAIIAGYPDDRVWGFKDPRTLLTLSGWLEALPSVRFVGAFRHPLAVAASLHARNQVPVEKSLNLWAAYNRLLVDYQRRFGFPMVCFDWPPERYHQSLQAIVSALNLKAPSEGFSFFESALRRNVAPGDGAVVDGVLARLRSWLPGHRDSGNAILPGPVAKLHHQLQEIAA